MLDGFCRLHRLPRGAGTEGLHAVGMATAPLHQSRTRSRPAGSGGYRTKHNADTALATSAQRFTVSHVLPSKWS